MIMAKPKYEEGHIFSNNIVLLERKGLIGKFLCSCKKEFKISFKNIVRFKNPSCGCKGFKKENLDFINKDLYKTWSGIKTRCYNKNSKSYPDYGGRGITVCDRWKNSFTDFLEDMGEKPSPKYTLDRLNNNLGYFKENCEWVTRDKQANNKRNNLILEYNGESMSATQWAKKLGFTHSVIISRYRKGWPIEHVLSSNLYRKGNRKVTFD